MKIMQTALVGAKQPAEQKKKDVGTSRAPATRVFVRQQCACRHVQKRPLQQEVLEDGNIKRALKAPFLFT